MSEVNRRYFESLMASRKLSLRALAGRMGMQHSQLSLTFSGARKMQLEEAAQLSQIFGVPIHRIIENAGVATGPASGKRVSVIGVVTGNGTVDLHDKAVVERTAAPEGTPEPLVAVQARTAGTSLDWIDGWVFFCREPDGVDPACIGRFCLAKLRKGPTVIAAVRRGYQEDTHNLVGPFSRESAALEWCSPIIVTRN